jgi:hypothetical protein
VTGTHDDRRELLKMLKASDSGDLVMVTRIDRLARTTFDLFAIAQQGEARTRWGKGATPGELARSYGGEKSTISPARCVGRYREKVNARV